MNGVTGRMGYRQHLVRSILAIRDAGRRAAVRRHPRPARAGPRRPPRRRRSEIAERHGLERWTTDLDAALADAERRRSTSTRRSRRRASQAIAGRDRGRQARLHREADAPSRSTARSSSPASPTRRGVKHGVVHDKLYLPGLLKLKRLVDERLLRPDPVGARRVRLLGLRGRLAAGAAAELELPRARTAAGSSLDMFSHWNYVLENLFGRVEAVTAKAVTHIPTALGRAGRSRTTRPPTTPPTAIFELDGGDRRADQLVLGRAGPPRRAGRVPGRRHRGQRRRRAARLPDPAPRGHAEAGLEPRPAGDRSASATQWHEVPDNDEFDNGFKAQWEQFLRHVVEDAPHPYDLLAGARGRAARRGRPAVLGRGPPRRAAGADAVRQPTVRERASCCRPAAEPVTPGPRAAAWPPPPAPVHRAGSPTPPRTSSPTRWRTTRPARRPSLDWELDARVPAPPVVVRARRRRGDGHRAARHGPGLAGDAGADPPHGGRGARVRRADRRRRRHRPRARRRRPRRGDRGLRASSSPSSRTPAPP